jgi:hypothetical protein
MNPKNSAISLLALGNLFSSLASGIVLAKGLALLRGPTFAFADSLLAYLVGSLLAFGMILYQRRHGGFRIWIFSSGAVLLSLGLSPGFALGHLESEAAYIFFFLLLCMFFSCTFVSRALRSDIAASQSQALTLVELAYSVGYLLGLGITRLSIIPKELIPIGLAVASTIDLVFAKVQIPPSPTEKNDTGQGLPALSGRVFYGSLLFFAMTLAVQIGTQRIASLTGSVGPLAAFEIGVTLAPIICLWASLGFDSATELSRIFIRSARYPASRFPLGRAIVALIAIGAGGMVLSGHSTGLVLLTLAACSYEVLSLLLLQWLAHGMPGAVSTAFAINGLLCSSSYALLLQASGRTTIVAIVLGVSAALATISFQMPPIFSRKKYSY